jgi:SAM-dependent methyltransferase
MDSVSVALFGLLGSVRGARVLDLACGHGRITRELAQRGAKVVGLDFSGALLDRARALEATDRLRITYIHADAASRSILDGEVFDVVVCRFGFSDIDDLDGTVATVTRVLEPTGRLVFSLLHPFFGGGRDVSGSWASAGSYYDEGWWVADGALSSLRRLGDRKWPETVLHLAQHPPAEHRGNPTVRRESLLATENGSPVALLDVETYHDGTASFAFVVDPSHRGRGVCRQAALALVAHLAKAGRPRALRRRRASQPGEHPVSRSGRFQIQLRPARRRGLPQVCTPGLTAAETTRAASRTLAGRHRSVDT